MIHLATDFAPAVRKADIALFFPANDFLTDARAVVAKREGISFAGMSNLTLGKVLKECTQGYGLEDSSQCGPGNNSNQGTVPA